MYLVCIFVGDGDGAGGAEWGGTNETVEDDCNGYEDDGREERSRLGVIETLRGMFPGESVRLTITRNDEANDSTTMDVDASIRDLNVMRESESDARVNGPRNVRLSGFDQVMQHDTVLDPDECGGPLMDTKGNVIGINIARAGRVVSYALPASLILPEMVSMLAEARSASR